MISLNSTSNSFSFLHLHPIFYDKKREASLSTTSIPFIIAKTLHLATAIDKMETFTKANMAPTMPELARMCSIGNVAASFARLNAETSESSDFSRYQKACDPHAELVLMVFGHVDHEEYCRKVAAQTALGLEQECPEKAKKARRRAAAFGAALRRLKTLKLERVGNKLAKIITTAASKSSRRHKLA